MGKAGLKDRGGPGTAGNVIDFEARRGAAELSIQYRSFSKAFGKALGKRRGVRAPGETNFFFSVSPNAKPFALRYARERLGFDSAALGDAQVLLWEAPEPRSAYGLSQVASSLLTLVGDPAPLKRGTVDEKMRRLGEAMRENEIPFMILSDLDHLVTPVKRLARQRLFRQVISMIKTLVKPAHVLLIGERNILEELLFQDEWVRQRCVELRWDEIGLISDAGR